ncbi:hypothetical protein [Rhodococcus opacus]|uniref:hypothetical protein n=1 Tax=Rhodococcus opacus TaxID=37919 RepID=UPI00211DF7BC|nr:hypothetical protein [Rhodococcus opacus]
MTGPATALPASGPRPRRHVDEGEYQAWVDAHVPQLPARWERMGAYRRFVERWPDLETWFAEPLLVRLGFVGEGMRSNGRTDSHRASGYLVYLSMVQGVGLDFEFLLARKYARLLDKAHLLRCVSTAGGGSVQLPNERALLGAGRVMAGSPADRKEKQAATHLPIRGIPQIRTVIRSPVWAVGGDLLLVAVVRRARGQRRRICGSGSGRRMPGWASSAG